MAQRRIGIAAPGRDATRTGSKRIMAMCGILAAILLGLKLHAVITGRTSGIDRAVVTVTSPAPVALEHAAGGLASLLQIFRLPAILHENEQLQQEKVYLQGRLDALQAAASDNANLRQQLGLGSADGCRAVHAAVIARPFDLWVDNVVLGVGSEQGVVPGCLVANASGLVGKVTEAGTGYCRVELVSSPQFRIAGVSKPGGFEGLVRGVGAGELSFDYVQALAKLDMGDKIYTRGGERIAAAPGIIPDPRTPRDVYIGRVVEKSSEQGGFLHIKLEPAVDINRLDALTVYVE